MIHQNSIDSYNDEKAKGRPGTFRRRIYNLLLEAQTAMTDRQIINALKESDVNNIRPEITRLIKRGLIFEVGRVKCEFTGKKVRKTCIKRRGERNGE